jgi:predicted metal-dependent phosphoesterase TrpH
MVLDLHIHTMRYSPCSLIYPLHLPFTARLFGLDGFAVTEHQYLWEEDEIEELKREAGIDGIVVLRGQEIRTCNEDGPEGDILVFGYPDTIEGPVSSEKLIEKIHAAGAVAVAAHPFRPSFGLGDRIFNLDLDGIEISTSSHTVSATQKAVSAGKTLSLAGLGASDAHRLAYFGQFLTWFENPVRTESELVEEIKARRCKPLSFTELLSTTPL